MLTTVHPTITRIQQEKPLILCLTNYVTMDLMANSLLALGAAPLMSVHDNELEELIQISQSVMLNIGTLDDAFIARCEKAALIAKNYRKPIIFDPVGAGASTLRTHAARQLMQHATIIRGNASEIIALLDDHHFTKGVESIAPTEQAQACAKQLAQHLNCTIFVSGEIDFITNATEEILISGGSALMPRVTGMGCTLTAVTAAFHSVLTNPYTAAYQAAQYFKHCGALAHQQAPYPGSFRMKFIDALYNNTIGDAYAE